MFESWDIEPMPPQLKFLIHFTKSNKREKTVFMDVLKLRYRLKPIYTEFQNISIEMSQIVHKFIQA